VALAVFLLITLAHVNLRRDTGATPRHLGIAALTRLLTLAAFAVKTYEDDPQNFVAMIVIFALAIVIDLVSKRMSGAPPTQTVVEETTSGGIARTSRVGQAEPALRKRGRDQDVVDREGRTGTGPIARRWLQKVRMKAEQACRIPR